MEKVFVISYDLKNRSKNYEGLYDAIKEAASWWHHLESFWIVVDEKSASQWGEKLRAQIDSDDSLLILEVNVKAHSGWLTQRAWDWINENTKNN